MKGSGSQLDENLDAFVASLQAATSVNTHDTQIEAWASTGQIATLSRLAGLLRARAASESRRDRCFDETLRHREEILALTPGIAFADTLAHLSVGAPLAWVRERLLSDQEEAWVREQVAFASAKLSRADLHVEWQGG
jgi:hypothetical protein